MHRFSSLWYNLEFNPFYHRRWRVLNQLYGRVISAKHHIVCKEFQLQSQLKKAVLCVVHKKVCTSLLAGFSCSAATAL